MQLHAYFSFNGNCQEALDLYSKALNGQVTELHPYSENQDMASKIPESWHNKIMHASFKAGDVFFMASDIMPDGNGPCSAKIIPENSPISLSLNFTSMAEQKKVFDQLAVGGTITMELQDTFWGAHFGMLTDKFGIKWLFNCEKTQHKSS